MVVVTWNTRELTLVCLEATQRALRASGLRGELIVVDNDSRDGTADHVRRAFPAARLIVRSRNGGFAVGANAGLRVMRGRHALLLNSDAVPLPGALEACVRFLDEHAEVGLVGPRLLRPDGRAERSVHAAPRLAKELLPPALRGSGWRRRTPRRGPFEVEALRGAALFARAAAVRDVGGLPEDYFFFLEETDWCGRMRRAGWRVVHHPGGAVLHRSGASSKQPHPTATRIEYHRSLYRYYRLHGGRVVVAAARALRFAKAAVYSVVHAPLAALSPRRRPRWLGHCAVVGWHLRGCPASHGLAGRPAGGRG